MSNIRSRRLKKSGKEGEILDNNPNDIQDSPAPVQRAINLQPSQAIHPTPIPNLPPQFPQQDQINLPYLPVSAESLGLGSHPSSLPVPCPSVQAGNNSKKTKNKAKGKKTEGKKPENQRKASIISDSSELTTSSKTIPKPPANPANINIKKTEVPLFQDSCLSDVSNEVIQGILKSRMNMIKNVKFGGIHKFDKNSSKMIEQVLENKEKIRREFEKIRNERNIVNDKIQDSLLSKLVNFKNNKVLNEENIKNSLRYELSGKNKKNQGPANKKPDHPKLAEGNRKEHEEEKKESLPKEWIWLYRENNKFTKYNYNISKKIEKKFQRGDKKIFISLEEKDDHYIDIHERKQVKIKDNTKRRVERRPKYHL